MRPLLAQGPTSACSGYLKLAMDGAVQFNPSVSIQVSTGGTAVVSVNGLVRVSTQALVEAEGSCAYQALLVVEA